MFLPTLRFLLALLVAVAALPVAAQQFDWPPTNLQVLPKDIDRDRLQAIMQGYGRALGVQCAYCHVAQPGGQPGRLNHASDDKEAKRVARGMIQMVAEINGRHLPGVGREVTERTRVTCATCHGGVRKPKALEFEVLDAYEAHGLDSAITRYKELREDYYGRSAYDFSDASLLSAASTIARDSARRGDALSLLRLNLEVNPQSWQSHQQIGQLLERSGDLPGALAAYDKALEVNPRAPRFLRAMRDSLQARIQRRP